MRVIRRCRRWVSHGMPSPRRVHAALCRSRRCTHRPEARRIRPRPEGVRGARRRSSAGEVRLAVARRAKQHGKARAARNAKRCPKVARKGSAPKTKSAKPAAPERASRATGPTATPTGRRPQSLRSSRPRPRMLQPMPAIADCRWSQPVPPTVSAPTLADVSPTTGAASTSTLARRSRLSHTMVRVPRGPQPRRPISVSAGCPLGEPGVGGRVTGLAVDPVDPNRLLVAGICWVWG